MRVVLQHFQFQMAGRADAIAAKTDRAGFLLGQFQKFGRRIDVKTVSNNQHLIDRDKPANSGRAVAMPPNQSAASQRNAGGSAVPRMQDDASHHILAAFQQTMSFADLRERQDGMDRHCDPAFLEQIDDDSLIIAR